MLQNQANFNQLAQSQSQYYETRLGNFAQMQNMATEVPGHWQDFLLALDNMGGDELENRRKENQRLLRENGVTYTVYSDKGQFNRPWKLDPIPLLISASEWEVIEQGLKQRACLLNLILKDLYTEQRILKQSIVPAQLIYAHHGFLTPCVGSLDNTEGLTIYAANLARGSNGNMWVLNDHAQAPSGIGYCLENRSVCGRVMADLFQGANVQRLTTFFSLLQKRLAQIAPQHKEEPHIVVLTPGALNETYFEHAYLASQMGFTLSQGDDLTVRDGKVWLRTLEGLQQVDVILRRVDDNYCDPLELRNSSRLGIAGLLQAVRSANVSIANPLGSSILENQGLLAFLPALSRYFLAEDLLLPSIASWWCGHKKERDFVIANLAKLAIKSIERGASQGVIFGPQLSSQQSDALIRKIKARPHLFIGQELIDFSTVPALVNGQIEARNSILRSFAVSNGDNYDVMPGGLTRVAASKDQISVSNQSGASNKDTWVLTDEGSTEPQPVIFTDNTVVPAISEPLTSRAADNLFWVGRHFERIQATSRLMRTIINKQSTQFTHHDNNSQQCLHTLLCALTHLTATYPGFLESAEILPAAQEQEILSLLKAPQRDGSIACSIQAFFQSAYNIRDLWSQDTWHCIDETQYFWQTEVVNSELLRSKVARYLSELSTRLAAFSGLTSESMSRESGWLMLQLGRRMERALSINSLLRATTVMKQPEALLNQILEAVLLSTDSFSLYQRRYRKAIRLPMLLELLLKDKNHPYSLLFQLQHLKQDIDSLPDHSHKNQLSREQGLILKAHTELQLCDINALLNVCDNGLYNDLDALLENMTSLLWRIADSITQRYFNHISETHQLAPGWQKDGL